MSFLAPLSPYSDIILLTLRIILGVTMLSYGMPKLKNPRKNAIDFVHMGFRPGWLWGWIAIITETAGALLVILGFFAWVGAALIAVEMLLGAIWKITKAKQPFSNWSYDLLILALSLVVLSMGPGRFSF